MAAKARGPVSTIAGAAGRTSQIQAFVRRRIARVTTLEFEIGRGVGRSLVAEESAVGIFCGGRGLAGEERTAGEKSHSEHQAEDEDSTPGQAAA